MRPIVFLVPLVAMLAAGCQSREKVAADAFRWQAPLQPGATLHIRNTLGSIVVRGGAAGPATVRATKRWRKGDEDDVRVVVETEGRDVAICSLYGGGGRCSSERYVSRSAPSGWSRFLDIFSLRNRRRSDVQVAYEVVLPAGAAVRVQTVNGTITLANAQGGVDAKTVNGAIRATSIGGEIRLVTVNGSVNATVAALADSDAVTMTTVNGSVEAVLPPLRDARVAMSTTNGRVMSDFPLERTRGTRRSMSGIIGEGRRRISLETVNGSVALRQAPGSAMSGSSTGAATGAANAGGAASAAGAAASAMPQP